MSPASLRQRLHWSFIDSTGQVRRALAGCASMLDVGGGDGSKWGPLWNALGLHVTILDCNVPSVRDQGARWQGVVADGARLPFRSGGFDAVVALDVIEHLPRALAFDLLDEIERVAARTVLVFTPNGFLPQPPAASNPFQEHVSGWFRADFTQRGYAVSGAGGPRPLRGMYAEPRIRPRPLGEAVSQALQPLVYKLPALAFSLIAVKQCGGAARSETAA